MAAEDEDRRVRTSSTRATFSALGFSIATSSSISIAAYSDDCPRMLEGSPRRAGLRPFQRHPCRTGCLWRPAIGCRIRLLPRPGPACRAGLGALAPAAPFLGPACRAGLGAWRLRLLFSG